MNLTDSAGIATVKNQQDVGGQTLDDMLNGGPREVSSGPLLLFAVLLRRNGTR